MKKLNFNNTKDIPVNKITEGNFAIRKYYPEESLNELVLSFTENGVLQAVVVEALSGGKYELIIGSRRLRAAKKIKLTTIPAVIVSGIDGRTKLELALAENLHRADLTPFEEALAILRLINEFKMTPAQVAKRIDKEESFVRRRLQLVSLPQEVQKLIADEKISLSHVSTLVNLGTPELQAQFARTAVRHNLDEQELKMFIQDELKTKVEERKQRSGTTSWKKVGLKIAIFTRWLKSTLHGEVKIVSPNDMYSLRAVLQDLLKEVNNSINHIQKGR